jgi:hypothetical protein
MLVALLFLYSYELDWFFNIDVLILPVLLFIPTLMVTVALFVGGILACLRRRWRRLASIVAALALFIWLDHLGVSPEWLHLQLHKRSYLGQIALCECGRTGLRFKVLEWGEFEEFGQGLVYDESDEIAFPADQQSVAWKQRVQSGFGSEDYDSILKDGYYSIIEPVNKCHSIAVKLVEGHFYFLTSVSWRHWC